MSLSLSEGTWMSLDVSPDGRTIAFDLLNDIYVLPAAGGEARPVHTGAAVQRSPQFSPDGTQLLYLSDESGADNLWISALDGSNPRQVSKESLAMITGPAWAPDGKSLIATRTSATVFEMRTSAIHRYTLATGADEQIVEPPKSGKDLQEARLSPDGRYLYYTERRGGEHYVYVNTGLANFVIRRKELRTGQSVDLIAGFGSATTPQVSPDGRSIAFIRRVQAKTVLFRYDVESRTQHPVFQELDRDLQGDYIPQEHYYPAFDWFPDNRHVAIWGKGQLLRVDMHSGEAQQIPFQATATHRIHAAIRPRQDAAPERVDVKVLQQAALAPRSNEIVFRALGKLWRQDFAGKRPPRRLTSSTHAQSEPAWSPDGRQIAYVEWNDEQGSSLKVHTSNGGRETVAARSRGMIREPVFSRDGKRIAYRIMEPDSSLGGAADPVGLYIVGADGKDGRFLAPATGVAQFSTDDRRIYFFGAPDYYGGKAVVLQSIGVDGGEVKDHAHAQTADTGDFTLSPDFKWIAFKELNQLYVMPYREGDASVAITAVGNTSARQLTQTGAYEPMWSADSATLAWMLGHDLHATSPDAAGLVSRPMRAIALSVKTDVPEGTVAFVNARILPMTDERIIERGVVVVERNRIKAVGAAGSVTVPPGAEDNRPRRQDSHAGTFRRAWTHRLLLPRRRDAGEAADALCRARLRRHHELRSLLERADQLRERGDDAGGRERRPAMAELRPGHLRSLGQARPRLQPHRQHRRCPQHRAPQAGDRRQHPQELQADHAPAETGSAAGGGGGRSDGGRGGRRSLLRQRHHDPRRLHQPRAQPAGGDVLRRPAAALQELRRCPARPR